MHAFVVRLLQIDAELSKARQVVKAIEIERDNWTDPRHFTDEMWTEYHEHLESVWLSQQEAEKNG